jgi:hypothetical protein
MHDGPNRCSCEQTIGAMRAAGKLDDGDAALVQLCLSAASALDEFPTRSTLIKEYRDCLTVLAVRGRSEGDSFADLLRELSAPVVDRSG